MTIWDSHMHTSFSGDCQTPAIDMINAAKEKKLPGITITDHLDLDFMEEPGMFDLDIPAYNKGIDELRDTESDENFKILRGIELGLQTHLADTHDAILSENNFDYVIGSLHLVNGRDPYYKEYFEGRNPVEAYRESYEAMLDNLYKYQNFDSLGHLDYMFRYGPAKELKIDSYIGFEKYVDEILDFIIKNEIALEINTGAFRCGLTEPNPNTSIIKKYKKMGGEIITIGGDAHKTEHVALNFENLPKLLNEIGFHEYVVFEQRKPRVFKI